MMQEKLRPNRGRPLGYQGVTSGIKSGMGGPMGWEQWVHLWAKVHGEQTQAYWS
jgi:hypothetical protein